MECGLTCRSTGHATAWHPGREPLCAHLPPRGQGATPPRAGYLYVRPRLPRSALCLNTARPRGLASSAPPRPVPRRNAENSSLFAHAVPFVGDDFALLQSLPVSHRRQRFAGPFFSRFPWVSAFRAHGARSSQVWHRLSRRRARCHRMAGLTQRSTRTCYGKSARPCAAHVYHAPHGRSALPPHAG
jgi:hypothetical protein